MGLSEHSFCNSHSFRPLTDSHQPALSDLLFQSERLVSRLLMSDSHLR